MMDETGSSNEPAPPSTPREAEIRENIRGEFEELIAMGYGSDLMLRRLIAYAAEKVALIERAERKFKTRIDRFMQD